MLKEKIDFLKDEKILSYSLLVSAMLYVSFRIVCSALFIKQINISMPFFSQPFLINYACFTNPLIYTFANLLILLAGKRVGLIMILLGIVCNCIFSFTISQVARFYIPDIMSSTELATTTAVNVLGQSTWQQYNSNILLIILVNFLEVFLFLGFSKFIKNFLFATLCSSLLIMFIKSMMLFYPQFPQDYMSCIEHAFALSVAIMFYYGIIFWGITYTFKINNFYRGDNNV